MSKINEQTSFAEDDHEVLEKAQNAFCSATFTLHVRYVFAKQPLFIPIYFDQWWGCGNTGNKTAHLFDMKADDY